MNPRLQKVIENSVSAQYIYQRKLKTVNSALMIISILTILVPIFVFISLYILKDTNYKDYSDLIATIISGFLLILSVLALILKFDEKRLGYMIGNRVNRSIEERARNLLNENDESKLELFFAHVADIDNDDKERIGEVSVLIRQEAYREALKKVDIHGKATCGVCNASPFIYTKGSCQTCGNTPSPKLETKNET